MKKTQKGFTLVEVIIVLVIIAILSVMLVPSLTGYIDNAKRSQVLAECKMATAAAQTLYGDYFASENSITYDEVETLAEVPGTVTLIATNTPVDPHVVVHLTYQNNGLTCTYCKYYSSCAEHDMLFSFTDGIGGEPGAGDGGGDNPGGTDPGGNIGGNEDYLEIKTPDGSEKYKSLGDIIQYIDDDSQKNGWGGNFQRNEIFYWAGYHYIVASGGISLNMGSQSSQLVELLGNQSIHRINQTLTTPSFETSRAGDVALMDGVYKIFNPHPWECNADRSPGGGDPQWIYNNRWEPLNGKIT